MASSGKRLSFPSFMFFRAAQRFFPTKPLAPVTNIFIFSTYYTYLHVSFFENILVIREIRGELFHNIWNTIQLVLDIL